MAKANADRAEERAEMAETQLRARGIRDGRVLAAMAAIPREEFVPEESRSRAYFDEPVPIGHAQTISQPFMVAFMAQTLELKGGETALEIGAGSGYQAAVLGQLAASVAAVEIIPQLAAYARENLARTGLNRNIEVICGDGASAAPERSFDAIVVSAGAPEIPARLLDRLNDNGRLVIPVGPMEDQELRLVTKSGGRIDSRVMTLCRFVPLRGEGGWR